MTLRMWIFNRKCSRQEKRVNFVLNSIEIANRCYEWTNEKAHRPIQVTSRYFYPPVTCRWGHLYIFTSWSKQTQQPAGAAQLPAFSGAVIDTVRKVAPAAVGLVERNTKHIPCSASPCGCHLCLLLWLCLRRMWKFPDQLGEHMLLLVVWLASVLEE